MTDNRRKEMAREILRDDSNFKMYYYEELQEFYNVK